LKGQRTKKKLDMEPLVLRREWGREGRGGGKKAWERSNTCRKGGGNYSKLAGKEGRREKKKGSISVPKSRSQLEVGPQAERCSTGPSLGKKKGRKTSPCGKAWTSFSRRLGQQTRRIPPQGRGTPETRPSKETRLSAPHLTCGACRGEGGGKKKCPFFCGGESFFFFFFFVVLFFFPLKDADRGVEGKKKKKRGNPTAVEDRRALQPSESRKKKGVSRAKKTEDRTSIQTS